jgi:hypothetical protein
MLANTQKGPCCEVPVGRGAADEVVEEADLLAEEVELIFVLDADEDDVATEQGPIIPPIYPAVFEK